MRDPALFEPRYRADGDLWHLATSPYELDRYQRTLDVLERPRYRSAYEPGCSVGVLTSLLAARCDRVVAVDVAPTAVALARERCIDVPNVDLRVGSMLDDPGGGHDLVVFSEVGYYVDLDTLGEVVDRLVAALDAGGELVACHWLGHSDDHRLHGDDVHEAIDHHPDLQHLRHERHEGFRLDTWRRS